MVLRNRHFRLWRTETAHQGTKIPLPQHPVNPPNNEHGGTHPPETASSTLGKWPTYQSPKCNAIAKAHIR